jgi:hypothetical protein
MDVLAVLLEVMGEEPSRFCYWLLRCRHDDAAPGFPGLFFLAAFLGRGGVGDRSLFLLRQFVCFAQFYRALIAADFDGLAADLHLDGVHIELAVTGGASFRGHLSSPFTPDWHAMIG